MLLMSVGRVSADRTASPQSEKAVLEEWETAVIDLFVQAGQVLGQPRSVGQIYGLLFCRDRPVSAEEVMESLSLSKGSVSQGLRSLRQFTAVRPIFVPGDRREHFIAEKALRQLVAGFLAEQIDVEMGRGAARLEQLETLVQEADEDSRGRAQDCQRILTSWHEKMRRLLPFAKRFL